MPTQVGRSSSSSSAAPTTETQKRAVDDQGDQYAAEPKPTPLLVEHWESKKWQAGDEGDQDGRRPTFTNDAIVASRTSEDTSARLMKKRPAEDEGDEERAQRAHVAQSDEVAEHVMEALEIME